LNTDLRIMQFNGQLDIISNTTSEIFQIGKLSFKNKENWVRSEKKLWYGDMQK